MTDSFRRAAGRKVVSRSSAERLGAVAHLDFDARERRVAAITIGRGRKTRVVGWQDVSGFGPDAVMVAGEELARQPADEHERAVAGGKLEPVGRRVLTAGGDELGTVEDVTFDPDTGAVQSVQLADREIPAAAVLSCGPYAVVVEAVPAPDA